jgi:cation:H+ antiporter
MEGVSFTARDRLKICVLAATAIPFVLVVIGKIGFANPFLVMGTTGLAIVAAAFFLSIATESLQTVVSQALALAILALIQVLPEWQPCGA